MAQIYEPSKGVTGYSSLPLDPSRCKAGVHGRHRWASYAQCGRKAVKDGWCKQHDPEAERARDAVAQEKFNAGRRKDALGWYGERWLTALAKIRDGDNDPRATANKALEGCPYDPR
jgi:hypothetical protein